MGHPNPDRVPIFHRRSRSETVADMLRERWDVISRRQDCGLIMRTDLALVIRVSGDLERRVTPPANSWRKRSLPRAYLGLWVRGCSLSKAVFAAESRAGTRSRTVIHTRLSATCS